MIVVHGTDSNSDEHAAAEELANAARKAIPNIDDSHETVLELFPGVQCFGQKAQDIDLLVFFADYRHPDKLIKSVEGKVIHSFCVAVEVKSHFFDSVHFAGSKCYVKYDGYDHDVTSQSERQKYSVKTYIERNSQTKKSPWIMNIIWLQNVHCDNLPKVDSNLIGSQPNWIDFIEKIALLNEWR